MSSTLPPIGRPDKIVLGVSAIPPCPAIGSSPESRLLATRCQLTPAGAGDHPLIQRLMLLSGHTVEADEFHLQLEEPGYCPESRIVVRLGGDVVGHVRLSRREMNCGTLRLTVAVVRELIVLPEYRTLGLASALLKAALTKASASGAQALLWNTTAERLAAEHGFALLARDASSVARPREVLAQLATAELIHLNPQPIEFAIGTAGQAQPLTLRLWRHYELEGLERLYALGTERTAGALLRDDERWRWLISRHGYDRIYVAIDGPDSWDLNSTHPRLVGYAVMRAARMVELFAAPHRADVAPQLLARACSDAIEQDCARLQFDAPASDPLHAVFAAASGEAQPAATTNRAWFIKLFEPSRWLHDLQPEFHRRLRGSDLPTAGEFGLHVSDDKWLFTIGARSVKLSAGKLGRSHLTLDATTLTRLLLGCTTLSSELASGQVHASTALATQFAESLFPAQAWWLPPWETLASCG
ncbi:MAG TPA: GNAT family N-acetyltransferase [Pirellulaceae bacterium]|nr:GNAT family N-acetyltransferase [Pirellulaceae bacterium]